MKVLVLGGSRFFGKRLVDLLLADGHEVVVTSRGVVPLGFEPQVRHVKADRRNRYDMTRIAAEGFDLVYDNVCFLPGEAMAGVEAFAGQDVRCVMTSSGSVYAPSGDLKEESFDPYAHEVELGSVELAYDEGKRQAEAVFARYATFPCAFVRFPVVLGMDDYSDRLQFHIRKIARKEPFHLPNTEVRLGFIRSDEAARFLFWLGTRTGLTGPVNAASDGWVSLRELFELIKEKTDGEVVIESDAGSADFSPFGFADDFRLNNDHAKSHGFEFLDVREWLPELVDELLVAGQAV